MVALGIGACMPVRIPESGSRQRVLFYAAATDLAPGSRIGLRRLEARLRRLDYHAVSKLTESGQYVLGRSGVDVWLRPFRYPGREFGGGRLRLRMLGEQITRVEPLDHFEPEDLRLEPERIAGYEGTTGAILDPLKLEDAPPLLVKGLVAVEDRRFYIHPGIDPIGLVRALWTNLRHGATAQGGSTLTQQLARSLYLHNERTVGRKIEEAYLALRLEARYSKKEILEAYLNAVYWGTWGSMEIRGAREASAYYLGTDLSKADPAGIALLIGLIPAPNAFSPYVNPEKAIARRNVVLRELGRKGLLSPEQVETALARPLPLRHPPARAAEASYFVDAVRREVEERASASILSEPGTEVFTTMDPDAQAAAEESLRKGLQDLEHGYRQLRRARDPLQGAVVAIDPSNGEVQALVGGRDFLEYPYNRAVEARRQPGSLFKPFVYLAAFRDPHREDGSYWTPATMLDDEPLSVTTGGRTWSPENYDREFRGKVSVRTALEQSINVPTARVAIEIGPNRVAQAARDLGIRSPLEEVPSLALGTSEVSLLEITGAYAGLAAEGTAHTPTVLRAIVEPDGHEAALSPLTDPPGVGRPEAYLVTNLLQGVIQEGTGKSARDLSDRGDVAGKTGTTDSDVDAWFVGYTPARAVGVWVGFDKRDQVGLTGAAAALPIWTDIMDQVEPPGGDGQFEQPKGIISLPIDPDSGLLATANCPTFRAEVFIEGTEPTQDCDLHGGTFISRLKRFLGF